MGGWEMEHTGGGGQEMEDDRLEMEDGLSYYY